MRPAAGIFTVLPDLRWIYVAATFLLLLLPLSIGWLTFPDQLLFRAGASLTPQTDAPVNLVKVTVPAREIERFQNDVTGAIALGQCLQGLRNIAPRATLLVLNQAPNLENYASDVLARRLLDNAQAHEQLHEQLQATGVLEDLQSLQARKENFQSLVHDNLLLVGISQPAISAMSGGTRVDDKVSYLRDGQQVRLAANADSNLLDVLTGIFDVTTPLLAHFHYETEMQALPLYQSTGTDYAMLWRVGGKGNELLMFPDASLALWNKNHGVTVQEWHAPQLMRNGVVMTLSAGARIYPFYSQAAGLPKDIETISLSELKTAADYTRLNNKVVILGEKDSTALDSAAATFYSLERNAYYLVPGWYYFAEKGALLVLLCYLFLLLPWIPLRLGFVISSVLVVALLVTPVTLQVMQRWWLPTGLLMFYLLLGHVIFLLWQTQRKLAGLSPVRALRPKDGNGSRTTAARTATRVIKPSSAMGEQTVLDSTRKLGKGKLIIGRYEIDREIGRGAMGVVYLGHDPRISREVAIKTLNYAAIPPDQVKEMKERFFREARAAGKLSHPNIVAIHDVGEESSLAFIAMDYVAGKPLSAYTKKGNLLPIDEVFWIVESVAYALGYAHEQGVVHRDIKPSNILYNREKEEIKVADFGIARLTDQSSTRTGETLGSPLYMSPEQIKGEKVTGQSDIFSLGITFYQLLTGELPFQGDSMVAISHQIVNEKYIPATDHNAKLPAIASRILARALHKQPDKRYATAFDMMDDLTKAREKGL